MTLRLYREPAAHDQSSAVRITVTDKNGQIIALRHGPLLDGGDNSICSLLGCQFGRCLEESTKPHLAKLLVKSFWRIVGLVQSSEGSPLVERMPELFNLRHMLSLHLASVSPGKRGPQDGDDEKSGSLPNPLQMIE
jgi:hypothetical protein